MKAVSKKSASAPPETAEVLPPESFQAEVEAEAPPLQVSVETAPSEKDLLRIAMLEDVSPAPIVGTYNFAKELGVTKLENRKTYRVPRHVAFRLQDSKCCVVLE